MMCRPSFMNGHHLVLNLEEADSCDDEHVFRYEMIGPKIKFLLYLLK